MKRFLLALLCLMMMLPLVACSNKNDEVVTNDNGADVVYKNANILTEDENNPNATAMAIKNGKIVFVGDSDDKRLNEYISNSTEVVDLGGKMITPNLIDAHTHPYAVGSTAWHTKLPEIYNNKEDILAYVKKFCEEHSTEEYPFIYFEYYPSNLFDENGPKKEWIDEVVSDRPILIQDFSDHACWVNSKFLELIKIDEVNDEDLLQHFARNEKGEFTGWILEGKWKVLADNMYDTINWYPENAPSEKVMSHMLDDLKTWGVTAVEDGYIESEEQLQVLKQMDDEGKLNMYYDAMVILHKYDTLQDCITDVKRLAQNYSTEHISVDTIKVFYDGTNEIGDAALIDGWIDDPSQTGYLFWNEDETYDAIKACNENDIDIHFHMVGDLAFRQVMNAVERLINDLGKLDIQVEVCHCELVDAEDMTRPAELGVIVNWTCQWSGGYFGDASLKYLGEERYNSMYNFNPMIDSGAIVTFGSDCYSMYEEERANPYFGMQTAMTRVDIWPGIYDGMREAETSKLSLENLLKGYTINAAIQLRIDDKTGSITEGKFANFNIYDVNLFDVDPFEFKDVTPNAVYFEGNKIS